MNPDALNDALGHAASDKRLEVLRCVAETGSISQAARQVGISYKAAWQAIDTLTTLSGVVLVGRTVGGAGGGGAEITAEGLQLLALSKELAAARQQVLAQFASGAALVGGLGLRTSMRNQLPCTVVQVHAGNEQDPVVTVILRGPGESALKASLTRESADLLGLTKGLKVLAMCKATAVLVRSWSATEPCDPLVPGLCALRGRVERTSPSQTHQEISIALQGGGIWVGFGVPGWSASMGDEVQAEIPHSALVIGLMSDF